MKETSDLVELLKYLDSQTLILLRIPPIDAGIPDASGRSNADAQSNNIETTVVSWKKITQDYVNYDLFPKINKSTNMLIFGPMNRFAVKQVIGVLKELNDLGLTKKSAQEFLKDYGLFFEEEKIFEEPMVPALDAAFNEAKDSRVKKDVGEGNKPREEVTTRPDQLNGEASE